MDYGRPTKYPSTPHLPQSRSRTNDDSILMSTRHFGGMEVVVTEKLDGENATLYSHHYHARSLDSRHHPSRDWIKAFWSARRADIPGHLRICGENLYAQHSIRYEGLKSYFYGFSAWDINDNTCLPWRDTLDWFGLLEIEPVPVLYEGPYSDAVIEHLIAGLDTAHQEGLVVRNAGAFAFGDFAHNVGKWVRPKHVQTETHWMHAEVIPNGLAGAAS
mgnify:CR=1 FL=1